MRAFPANLQLTVAKFNQDLMQIISEKVTVSREVILDLQTRFQAIADKVSSQSFTSNKQVNEIRNQLSRMQGEMQSIPVQ